MKNWVLQRTGSKAESRIRVNQWIYAIPWCFMTLSVVMFYQYHLRLGIALFWTMVLAFGAEGIWGLVRRTYRAVPGTVVLQRAIIYVPVAVFYVLAVASGRVAKTNLVLILIEGAVLLLRGIWFARAFQVMREQGWHPGFHVDQYTLVLWGAALCFFLTIAHQAGGMYRWDSLDYCSQVNSMLQAFDFTFSNLATVFTGHISMGFVFVYELGLLLFGGNPNHLIYTNGILGILVEACIYFMLKDLFPGKRKGRLVLATCFVMVMPLFFGVNGCISTDYIMACFFIFFLYAHLKDYRILQLVCASILITTKETAAVLLCAFCFAFLFIELPRKRKTERMAFIRRELINVLPVGVWFLILATTNKAGFLKAEMLLNWKVLVLLLTAVLILVLVIYACYTRRLRIHIPAFGLVSCGVILAGLCVSVFSGPVEGQYGMIEGVNSIGLAGMGYVLIRLKNIFLLNFQWLYWLYIVGLLLFVLRTGKKPYKSSYIYAILVTILGFVAVHCVFVTYAHPRYFQPVVLLVGWMGAVLALAHKERVVYIAMFAIMALSFVQNFAGIDKVAETAYVAVSTGEETMITTSYFRKEAAYTDAIVYNYEYTYLNDILREFVSDINPQEDTLLLMPDVAYPYMKSNRSRYVVWGTLWYNNAAKEVYYGSGRLKSFAEDGDVRLAIKAVNSEKELNFDKYDRIFYIDIPATEEPADTSLWFAQNYRLMEYQTYEKMGWKIDTYLVLP